MPTTNPHQPQGHTISRILTQPPLKHLYFFSNLFLTLTLRLSIWSLYFIPSFLRPSPHWTWRKALKVRLLKDVVASISLVEMGPVLSWEAGKEGDRWAKLVPAAASKYVGPVEGSKDVKPEVVGGTWYPARPRGAGEVGEYVVMHVHGGAFVVNTGRIDDGAFAAATILKKTKASHVFMPQYRLSLDDSCRFPAGLQDVVTSYCYLTQELGVPASKIVLSGDSAGANLVLAFVKYLAEYGGQVQLESPRAAWLWCCFINPSTSYHSTTHYDTIPQTQTDYLCGVFGAWGARSYAPNPPSTITIDHPYISFSHHPFATKVPLFFQAGTGEALLVEICAFYEEMNTVKGNVVKLELTEGDAPHDVMYVGDKVGFEVEAEEMVVKAARWIGEVAR